MALGTLTGILNEGVIFIAHPPVALDVGETCTGSEGINLREVLVEGVSRSICTCTGCGRDWLIPEK